MSTLGPEGATDHANRFIRARASIWTTKGLPKDRRSRCQTTDLFERTPKPSPEEQMPTSRLIDRVHSTGCCTFHKHF